VADVVQTAAPVHIVAVLVYGPRKIQCEEGQMSKDTYAPGEPCWVDCGTDVDKATAFYTPLFGWKVNSLGPEAGGYCMVDKDGAEVCGLGPQMNPGPPTWSVYFATEDATKTAELVTTNGGTTIMEPTKVGDSGSMAVFADPVGAVFSVWQAGGHTGFGEHDTPGTYCWAELITTDVPRAAKFYASVFGFGSKKGTDGGIDYTEFQLGDQSVAGMMHRPAEMPETVPPFWSVYFAVADTDATLAKITELGGSTLAGPMDLPVGRFAACQDSAGAMFNVIALAPR
jgi:predicted enzyme related to lactoylglutathione lyase